MYLDANNLYGWAVSQKLHVTSFKWVKNLSQFNEDFIKNYYKNSIFLIFIKVFCSQLKEKKKSKKPDCSVHDKGNYVVRIRALKQALNHGLVLKKYTE